MKKRFLALILCLSLALSLVPVTAVAAEAHDFQDVPSTHWANKSVQYVYENGLMDGVGPTTFRLNGTLTRAMFVTILGRLDGERVNNNADSTFVDVAKGQWYTSYVVWASQNGIVDGYGNHRFGPNDFVTREQMATMIARYKESKKLTLPDADAPTALFSDRNTVSSWAQEGVELMRRTGIISGYSDDSFKPQKTATRAEAATVFMRFHLVITGGTVGIEGFDFQDGVIALPGSIQHKDNGKTVLLPKQENLENLKKGDIIVVGTEAAYKVTSSSVVGDSIQVQYTSPELYEFLDSIDVQGEAYADFSEFIPADGVNITYNSVKESPYTSPKGLKGTWDPNIDIELKGSIPFDGEKKISFSLKESIPSVSYKFDIDFDPRAIFNDKSVVTVNDAYIKLQKELDIVLAMSKESTSSSKRLPLGSVPIVGSNGLGILVDLAVVITTEGTFEVHYNVSGVLGCQVYHNQPRNLTTLTATQDINLNASVKIGPKLSLSAKVFKKDLLKFSVDAGVQGKGEAISRPTGTICLDCGVSLYANVSAFDDDLIENYLHLNKTWHIWDDNNSPIKESIHFENMQKVPSCTFEGPPKRFVSGSVYDSKSTMPLPNASVSVICTFASGETNTAINGVTDTAGHFCLELPQNVIAPISVYVEKDSYSSYTYHFKNGGPSSYTDIKINLEKKEIEVPLKDRYLNFLSEKEYQSFISDWMFGLPNEYAILDINKDGIDELIITGGGDLGWYNFSVFSYDRISQKIYPIPIQGYAGDQPENNAQYYGSLEYSPTYHALVFTEFNDGTMFGGLDYFTINNRRIVIEFSLRFEQNYETQDISYSMYNPHTNKNESLSEEDWDAYLLESIPIEFTPFP